MIAHTSSSSSSAPSLPRCKYGTTCYRQNPQHIRDFDHSQPPMDDEDEASASTPSNLPSSDDGDEDEDDDDDVSVSSRTVRGGRLKSTAASASASATVDDDDDDNATTRRRRSTAIRSTAATTKGSTKKTSRRASSSPAGRRRSRAPLAASAAAAVAVVDAPVIPPPDAAAVVADEEKDVDPGRFPVNKAVLKRLALFGLLWSFTFACFWFHFHLLEKWLSDCKGDHLFDCATGNAGRYVPLHENGGSCAVLRNLPRWREKACRELWWVVEGETHPQINCRELCNCNAQAPMYGIIVAALAISWIFDALAAVFAPVNGVTSEEATQRGLGPMLRCIALGVFDGLCLVTVTGVPTVSTGSIIFISLVMLVMHAVCAIVLISKTAEPAGPSKGRRRRRPTMHSSRHSEEGAFALVCSPVIIAVLVASARLLDSDVGLRGRLWNIATTWQLGGESWMFLALTIQTAFLTLYVHNRWKQARVKPEEE